MGSCSCVTEGFSNAIYVYRHEGVTLVFAGAIIAAVGSVLYAYSQATLTQMIVCDSTGGAAFPGGIAFASYKPATTTTTPSLPLAEFMALVADDSQNERLQRYLEEHPEAARQKDDKGNLPVHLAVHSPKNLAIILTACPLSINEPGEGGRTPLCFAMKKPRNLAVIQLLITSGAENKATPPSGTPFEALLGTLILKKTADPEDLEILRLLKPLVADVEGEIDQLVANLPRLVANQGHAPKSNEFYVAKGAAMKVLMASL